MMGSAASLRDRFSRLAVGGIALYFAAHLFINVSVNLGLLPLTGLTLPLFSTGGSSLLTTFLLLGLGLGLCAHHEPVIERIERVSRPGLRVYKKADDIPKVQGGLGVAIVSTSAGVMSDRQARAQGRGGEILCFVS
jgi:hypothetical protein